MFCYTITQSKRQWKRERKAEKRGKLIEDSDDDDDKDVDFLGAFGSLTGRISTILGMNVSDLLPQLSHEPHCLGVIANISLRMRKDKTLDLQENVLPAVFCLEACITSGTIMMLNSKVCFFMYIEVSASCCLDKCQWLFHTQQRSSEIVLFYFFLPL